MNQPNSEICFNLLENAIDSLDTGIDLITWEREASDSNKLKRAVLSAAHGAELLLKERLRRIHPSLLWENVDKYPSLEARTVTIDQAMVRLRRIGNVQLSESDVSILRSLRNTRNAIEHFYWRTTRNEAQFIIANGLWWAIRFAREHLGIDLEYRHKRGDTWQRMLAQLSPHLAPPPEAMNTNSAEQSADPLVACDFCRAAAVPLSGGACMLCGHWRPWGELAEDQRPF